MAALGAELRGAERLSLAILLAGVLGGLLMIVTEFSTVASVELQLDSCETQIADSAQRDRCVLDGFERHGGALLLLGLLAVAMAWGAGLGRSRPAAIALLVLGAIVVLIGLLIDLPETNETGAVGRNFEGATAQAGAGLYLEIVAGLLAMLSGSLRLTRRGSAASRE